MMHEHGLHTYDNPHLIIHENHPTARISAFTSTPPIEGMIVKQLFSLTGTRDEHSLLRQLPQSITLALHPGYASIGRVEQTGARCQRFQTGDLVLLPPCASTYVSYELPVQHTFIHKLPHTVDPVNALFIPLVCLALHLMQLGRAIEHTTIHFLGCGLSGAILLQLLHVELSDTTCIVYREQDDLPAAWLATHGAHKVIQPQAHSSIPIEPDSLCYLFSPSACFQSLLAASNGTCISALPSQEAPPTTHWFHRDACAEALSLLTQPDLSIHDLIAQHVHVEAIDHVYRAICANHYRGKALVYDW